LSARHVSEQATRYSLIDPQLRRAGWNLSDRTQVGLEIPISGYDADLSEGISDYALYRPAGEVLAVVEAKRTSRDPRVGKEQVLQYVTGIEKKQSFRPFAFMANGEDIFFWDSLLSAERRVAGFFSRENLELRAVQTVFLDRKKVELADLYEEPFTSFGMNAVERLFSGKEIEEWQRFVRRLAA
jgi:type I site-specific restriction endonuclease